MRNASVSSSCSLHSISRERSNSCASNCSNGSSGNMSPNLPSRFRKISSSCDIVKSGHMFIKRPPTSGSVKLRLKTWQKRFFVLRDQSFEKGTAHLEIYDSEGSWRKDKVSLQEYMFVDLQTVAHVDEYTDSKNYPNAFTIARAGHGPLVLGTESQYDLKEWMVAIQVLSDKLKTRHSNNATTDNTQDNVPTRRPSCPPKITHWSSAHQLHNLEVSTVNNNNNNGSTNLEKREEGRKNSIRILKLPNTTAACSDCLVTVHKTDDSERNNLSGEYYMIVIRDEIFLQKPGTLGEVITWPIQHIVKLKSEDELDSGSNIITLEARVKCGRAHGKYLFRTSYGRQIIQKVMDMRSRQSSRGSQHDEELERLRVKSLSRAPSSPDLLNRCSPPRIAARSKSRSPSDSRPDIIPTGRQQDESAYLDDKTIITDPLDIPIMLTDNGLHIASIQIPNMNRPVDLSTPQDKLSDIPPEVPSRQRKPSNTSGTPKPYLHLMGNSSANHLGDKHEPIEPPRRHSLMDETIKSSQTSVPRSSPGSARRKLSKLPPLPPNALERTSPPKSNAIDIPPSLPPRRSSGSPPPPPPRPQHTLGTNSSPV